MGRGQTEIEHEAGEREQSPMLKVQIQTVLVLLCRGRLG